MIRLNKINWCPVPTSDKYRQMNFMNWQGALCYGCLARSSNIRLACYRTVGWTPQLRTWVAVLDSSIAMCIYIYIYYNYPIITHLLVHLGSSPYVCFISCGYSYLIHLPFICWSVSRREQTTCWHGNKNIFWLTVTCAHSLSWLSCNSFRHIGKRCCFAAGIHSALIIVFWSDIAWIWSQ